MERTILTVFPPQKKKEYREKNKNKISPRTFASYTPAPVCNWALLQYIYRHFSGRSGLSERFSNTWTVFAEIITNRAKRNGVLTKIKKNKKNHPSGLRKSNSKTRCLHLSSPTTRAPIRPRRTRARKSTPRGSGGVRYPVGNPKTPLSVLFSSAHTRFRHSVFAGLRLTLMTTQCHGTTHRVLTTKLHFTNVSGLSSNRYGDCIVITICVTPLVMCQKKKKLKSKTLRRIFFWKF